MNQELFLSSEVRRNVQLLNVLPGICLINPIQFSAYDTPRGGADKVRNIDILRFEALHSGDPISSILPTTACDSRSKIPQPICLVRPLSKLPLGSCKFDVRIGLQKQRPILSSFDNYWMSEKTAWIEEDRSKSWQIYYGEVL